MSKIHIREPSSFLACIQLAQTVAPNDVLSISFGTDGCSFACVDMCCVVHVAFDPTVVSLVVPSEPVVVHLTISKWSSIVSLAVKAKSHLTLATDQSCVRVLTSDGTEMSADQDEALNEEDVDVSALFDSVRSPEVQRLALGFDTTTTLASHLSPFADFKCVRFDPHESTTETTTLKVIGIEHTKTDGLTCTRTIGNVRSLRPIASSDAEITRTLTFNTHYLTKLVSSPSGKKCILGIAHSSESNQHVLLCRYTIDSVSTPAKRKEGEDPKPTSASHKVLCMLSSSIEEEN